MKRIGYLFMLLIMSFGMIISAKQHHIGETIICVALFGMWSCRYYEAFIEKKS